MDTCAATVALNPKQIPPNKERPLTGHRFNHTIRIRFCPLRTPITSEMALLTMFSEWGTIEGGRKFGLGEFSSEELYGKQRYPEELRMMSQEVEDVLISGSQPLDVLNFRPPQCSMPAPEADQARITPAYHQDKEEAKEYLRSALVARQAAGYVDCSTCPERLIFEHLWLDNGQLLADSQETSNPFRGRWTYVESQQEQWDDLTHVDIWSVAQLIQRKGVLAESDLLELAKRDPGRCIWPVSLMRHPVANVASSNAVQDVLHPYPWADSGSFWEGTMVFKERSGEDRSALMAASSKPGQAPAKGQLRPPVLEWMLRLLPCHQQRRPVLRQRQRLLREGWPAQEGRRVISLPLYQVTKGHQRPRRPRTQELECNQLLQKAPSVHSIVGTGFPTLAESLGQKKGPPQKAAPSTRASTAQLSSTKKSDTDKQKDTEAATAVTKAPSPQSAELSASAVDVSMDANAVCLVRTARSSSSAGNGSRSGDG